MQFMRMLKASSKPGRNIIATLAIVGVVASVLSFVPTHGAANTLAETCANPPAVPTFNYWPVTFDDTHTPLCHDFPAIDAAVDAANPQFSQSETDWNDGLTLADGQTGDALMYIHNGAANNLDPNITTARDVKITTQTDTTVGPTHQIRVTYTATNASPYTKSFTVKTPANSKLEVIPNTGFMYDYMGRDVLNQQHLNLGNSTFSLGDLDSCFEFSLFLSFKFKVVPQTPPTVTNTTLSITKGVRNITRDNTPGRTHTYNTSVTAVKGERVGYKVLVTNTGSVVAHNVTVTDPGVTGVTIDANSTFVGYAEDVEAPTALWSGSIPGTINLGDLAPGDHRVVIYTGTVMTPVLNDTNNCPTLVNTARAVAANAPAVSATASVVLTNCVNTDTSKIAIKKLVSTDSSRYTDSSVDVHNGDSAYFKITVTNSGNTTLNNVVMVDNIPSGLSYNDSVSGDGTASFNNSVLTVNFGSISAGQSKYVQFATKVNIDESKTICNIAKATATGVASVQDDACVNVIHNTTPPPHGNGSANIVLSKRAFNDTKNVDASSTNAARGDYITYSLVTTNNGTADKNNYVVTDDLSQVLPLADIISTDGGNISGNVITYPEMTIRKGETIVKTFKVRVKQTLSAQLSYQLRNTYGNTIVINVPGQVVYQAPKTGAAGTSAAAFAGLITAGFVVARKRGSILKFIFA